LAHFSIFKKFLQNAASCQKSLAQYILPSLYFTQTHTRSRTMSMLSEPRYISFDTSMLTIQYTAEKPKQSAVEILSHIKNAVEISSISDQLADQLLLAATRIYKGYCEKHASFEKQKDGSYLPVKAKNFSMSRAVSTVIRLYERIQLRVKGSGFFPVPPEILCHIFQFLPIQDMVSCSRITRSAFSAMGAVWKDRAKLFQKNTCIAEENPVRQLQAQFASVRELYERKLLPYTSIVTKKKYVFATILSVEETLLNVIRYENYSMDRYVAPILFHSAEQIDIKKFSAWPHLLNCGASPRLICSFTGNTLLHQTVFYPCDPGLITRLVACGLDPNRQNFRKNTPVHTAAKLGTLQHLLCLEKHGGNLMATTKEGATPLHLAIKYARAEKGAPCIWAHMRIKAIKWLLEKRKSVNEQDARGNTALHYATKLVYLKPCDLFYTVDVSPWVIEVVKALLAKGADPAIYNVKKRQPLDYTCVRRTSKVVFYSQRAQELRALLGSSSTPSFSEEEEFSSEDTGDEYPPDDADLFTLVDAMRKTAL
jgi:ankyrin repeat protein